MDKTEQLLKDVTEAHGVPGAEYEVRDVLYNYLEPFGTISTDKIGSLICDRGGDGPKIMVAAHMDEIGFMVRHITKDGFIKFIQLGGWWDQVLLGHRVIIKTREQDVLGVIGAKPPHLIPRAQRSKVVTKDNMYIDVGVSSRRDVEDLGIRVGDYIVPDSKFDIIGTGKTYLSKAFDDRVGCAVLVKTMEALKEETLPNQLFGVTTVQEEIGARGADTSVSVIKPDIGIVLEGGIAGDVPGIKDEVSSEKLGGGPVIAIYDSGMISHNKLRDLFLDVADELDMKTQHSLITGGGTDGRYIQRYEAGTPTITLSVSARHIHSHNSMINRDDFDQTVELLTAVLRKLDKDTVEELQSFGY